MRRADVREVSAVDAAWHGATFMQVGETFNSQNYGDERSSAVSRSRKVGVTERWLNPYLTEREVRTGTNACATPRAAWLLDDGMAELKWRAVWLLDDGEGGKRHGGYFRVGG